MENGDHPEKSKSHKKRRAPEPSSEKSANDEEEILNQYMEKNALEGFATTLINCHSRMKSSCAWLQTQINRNSSEEWFSNKKNKHIIDTLIFTQLSMKQSLTKIEEYYGKRAFGRMLLQAEKDRKEKKKEADKAKKELEKIRREMEEKNRKETEGEKKEEEKSEEDENIEDKIKSMTDEPVDEPEDFNEEMFNI